MEPSLEEELLSLTTPRQEIIYHYTTISALFNGILTENDICLWATNAQYMNDPQDILFGLNLSSKAFCDKDIEKDIDSIKQVFLDNSFITSFSYKNDFLPMWSMYGANGAGISLGFKHDLMTTKNQSFFNCLYFSKKEPEKIVDLLMKIINPLIDNAFLLKKHKKENTSFKDIKSDLLNSGINLGVSLYRMICTICAAKNSAYSYEEEVRLMNLNPTNIKFRKQENIIVPYIEQHFPKDALQEIIIGPTNNMEQSESSLRTYLDNLGYKHVTIKRSKVPYRAKVC